MRNVELEPGKEALEVLDNVLNRGDVIGSQVQGVVPDHVEPVERVHGRVFPGLDGVREFLDFGQLESGELLRSVCIALHSERVAFQWQIRIKVKGLGEIATRAEHTKQLRWADLRIARGRQAEEKIFSGLEHSPVYWSRDGCRRLESWGVRSLSFVTRGRFKPS